MRKKSLLVAILSGISAFQIHAQVMTVTPSAGVASHDDMFCFDEEATITFSSGKMKVIPASGKGAEKTYDITSKNTDLSFSQDQVEPVQLRIPVGQSYGICTYVATNPLDISQTKGATDLTGYVLTSGSSTYVTAAKQMQIVSGGAFILRGEPGWYCLPVTDAEIPAYKNILQGSLDLEYMVKEEDRIYALSNYGEFWRVEAGVSVPYKKAYYVAKAGTPLPPQTLSILFDADDEDVTMAGGVKAVESDDAPAYNLAGQRVNGNGKGVVVKNGKKLIN